MISNFSVFDIIGPRMTGPSSSHTAGAARLALVARKIAGDDVAEASFTLYGSFAETGKGHGTDKALIGGILGMEPDDPSIREAYAVAAERGVLVNVDFSDEAPVHPNTARIHVVSSTGKTTDVLGTSIGGGNIRITEINGLSVEFTGEYHTLIAQYEDEPGIISAISTVLARLNINIAFMKVFRHGKGESALMTIETDQEITQEVLSTILLLCPTLQNVFAV